MIYVKSNNWLDMQISKAMKKDHQLDTNDENVIRWKTENVNEMLEVENHDGWIQQNSRNWKSEIWLSTLNIGGVLEKYKQYVMADYKLWSGEIKDTQEEKSLGTVMGFCGWGGGEPLRTLPAVFKASTGRESRHGKNLYK